MQQAKTLVDAIDAKVRRDPVVVGGDFNANPDTEAMETITLPGS